MGAILPPFNDFLFRADVGIYADTSVATPAVSGSAWALWQDQSGNGNHLYGVGSTYNSNVVGLPCALFNGTSHYAKFANVMLPGPRTLYAVLSTDNTGVKTIVAGNNNSLQWRMDSGKQRFVSAGVVDIGTASTTLTANAWQQINASWDFNQAIFRSKKADDARLFSSTDLGYAAIRYVGAANNGSYIDYFGGGIVALIGFGGVHTTQQRKSVEAWITTTFGV